MEIEIRATFTEAPPDLQKRNLRAAYNSFHFISHSMRVFNTRAYTSWLQRHYEDHFNMDGIPHTLPDINKRLHKDFFVLEIPPNRRRNMYTYCTVGMSCDRLDDNLIEMFVYSPVRSKELVVLMSWCAAYHRNRLAIKTNHTINIGQPWLLDSPCDHGLVSRPHLEGEEFEFFHFEGHYVHCHWFIPITARERDYRLKYGPQALEKLFKKKQVDFLNPYRNCLILGE